MTPQEKIKMIKVIMELLQMQESSKNLPKTFGPLFDEDTIKLMKEALRRCLL